MKKQLIYKVEFDTTGRPAEMWNGLSDLEKEEYIKERDSVPDYVIAKNLGEALTKVSQQNLKFFVPSQFTIHAHGNVVL
jgi:DNA topoisomerase IA